MGFGLIKALRPRAAFLNTDKVLTGLGGPGTDLPLINADVYYHEAHFPVSSARLLGTFLVDEPIYFKLALDQDTDVAIRSIGRNARGLRTSASVAEAEPSIKLVKGLGTGGSTALGVPLQNQHTALMPVRPVLNSELPFIQFADEGDALARSQIKNRRTPTGAQNVITDWNCSGDGRIYKVSMTAGSKIVTILPGQSFDADAGVLDQHPVPYWVEGTTHSFRGGQGVRFIQPLGPGSPDQYTTITAVAGNSITLADAALGTFSGAPFCHDDTAALQAAINNRGHIWIPEGRYWCSRRLLWPSMGTGLNQQIILEGDGEWRSVIMFNHDGNGLALDGPLQTGNTNSGVYDAVIRNLGLWCVPDNNKEGIRQSSMGHGLAFTATHRGDGTPTGGVPGVPGPSTGNVRVENVLLQGWGRWGLWSDNLQSAFLTNIKGYHCRSGAIALVGNATRRGTSQQEDNSIEITNSLVVYSGPNDFGGAGDTLKTLTGGSINVSAPRSLTVAGGLVASDVGRIVKLVNGPGVDTTTHVTMIESVQSATACTISMPVWQSASGFQVIVYQTSLANIFLHTANNVRISGGTHQGNWVAWDGDAGGVRAEHLDALRIDGLWEEDAGGALGAAIDLYDCRAVSIDSSHTGGSIDVDPPITPSGHGVGIKITDCQGVKVRGTYLGQSGSGTAYQTHGATQGVEFDNCYGADWVAGIANTDASMAVGGEAAIIGPGCHSLSFDNAQTNTLALWDEKWTNVVANPNFLDGLVGWSTPTAGVVTQPGYPYTLLPARWERYVVVNTQALGTGLVDVLTQDVPVPDSRQNGQWTLAWDHYIESRGAGGTTDNSTVVTIEVRTATAGYTTRSVTLTADAGYGLPVGRWMRLCIKTNLDGGITGRFFRIRFSNQGTANSPIFRVANLRLQPGISGTFDADQPITQERGGSLYAPLYFRPIDVGQFPPPPPPAAPAVSLVNVGGILKLGAGGVYAAIGGGSVGPGTPNKLAMFGPTPGNTVVDGPAIATPSELVILGVGLRVENNRAVDTLYSGTNYCPLAICGSDDVVRFGPKFASNGTSDGSIVLLQAGGGVGPQGQFWNNGVTGCLTYGADYNDNASTKSWGASVLHLATTTGVTDQHGLTLHATPNTGYTGRFIQCLSGNLHLTQFAVEDDGNLGVIRRKAYSWPTGTIPPIDTAHPVKVLGYTDAGPPVVLNWIDPPGGPSTGAIIAGTANRVAKFNTTGDNVTNSAILDRTTVDGFIFADCPQGFVFDRTDALDLSPDLYFRTGAINDAILRYERRPSAIPLTQNQADGELQLFLHSNLDSTHASSPFIAFGTVHSWFQTTLRVRPYFNASAGNSIEVWAPTTSIPYFAVAQDGNLAIIRQVTYAWPFDHPTAPATQKYLRCDATGNLTWDSPTGAGGNVVVTAPQGTNLRVPRWSGTSPTTTLVDSAIEDRTSTTGTIEFTCNQLLFHRTDALDYMDFYQRTGAGISSLWRYDRRAQAFNGGGVQDGANTDEIQVWLNFTGAFPTLTNIVLGNVRSWFTGGVRIRPSAANTGVVGNSLELRTSTDGPAFYVDQLGNMVRIAGVAYTTWPAALPTGTAKFLQCDLAGALTWATPAAGSGTVGPGTVGTLAMFVTNTTTVGNSQLTQDAARVYINSRDLLVIGDPAVADLAQLGLQASPSNTYGIWRFEHRNVGVYDTINTAGEMQLRVNADVTHLALGAKRSYFTSALRVRYPDTSDYPIAVCTPGGALTNLCFRVDTDGGLGIIRSVNYTWPAGPLTYPVGGAYKFLGFSTTSGTPQLGWFDAPAASGGGANVFLSNLSESTPGDHTTSGVAINTWVLPGTNADGTAGNAINLGSPSKKFNAAYFYSGAFVYPINSTDTGPRAFGFIPTGAAYSTAEATRFLIYGDRNCFQSGDKVRTQIASYLGIELTGNRRDPAAPGYTRQLVATNEDTAVTIGSPNDSIGLYVNLIAGNTRDPIRCGVGGGLVFKVSPLGDLTIHSVSMLWPAAVAAVNGYVLSMSDRTTGQLAWIPPPAGGSGVTWNSGTAGPLAGYLTKWTPGAAPYQIQNSSINDNGVQVTVNNPFKVTISGTDKFSVNNQGTVYAAGGTRLGVKNIQLSGGATYTLALTDRTLLVDTVFQSQTVYLPLANSCPGQIFDVIALRQHQAILDSPAATGYTNVITLTVQGSDVFNAWSGSSALTFQLSFAGASRKAVKLIADTSLNIWWLLQYME